MSTSSIKVTFLQVASPKEKIDKLLKIVTDYYENQKVLLLKTDSEETTSYLDNLLWQIPKESFLPHSLSLNTFSYLYLSSEQNIPASICSIFNFTKHPLTPTDSITKIYEFEDLSSAERKKIFETKYHTYAQQGYHLISL